MKIDDLVDLDDKINDENVLDLRPEINHRDGCFMYYDGDIYIGNSSQTHNDLIDKVSKEYNLNGDVLLRARQGFFDIDSSLAFGHIINNCAFLDKVTIVNAYSSEIAEALKNYGFDKVYLLTEKKTKRLAHAIQTLKELPDIEDDVNDTVEIENGYVEKGRDKAFVYYDGEVYTGITHTSIISNLSIDKKTYMEIMSLRTVGFGKKSIDSDIKFAAGHIIGNIAVIEKDTMNNVDMQEIISKLNYDKVYIAETFNSNSIKRIAKRLKKYVF